MANTTFNGTVRSDGDIKATTKNTTTGAYVDYAAIKAAGGMEIEKVASTGNNIVAAGTSTGTNNGSLGTAADFGNLTDARGSISSSSQGHGGLDVFDPTTRT